MKIEKLVLEVQDNKNKPILLLSSKAYAELVSMHDTQYSKSKEFMYIGEVVKDGNIYLVEHFNIVPQCKNSGAYCETDDEKYATWLQETYPIKERNKVRLHGHSHVNMGTSPSGTDDTNVLNMMKFVDDYFIQMISNNRLVTTFNLYDKQNMLIYKDLEYNIIMENGVLVNTKGEILTGLEDSIKKYKPTYSDKKIIFKEGIYFDWDSKRLIVEDLYITVQDGNKSILTEVFTEDYQKALEKYADNSVITKVTPQATCYPKYDSDYYYEKYGGHGYNGYISTPANIYTPSQKEETKVTKKESKKSKKEDKVKC